MASVLAAAAYAEKVHREDSRPDVNSSPWVSHSLAVANRLTQHGVVDPLLLQVALLADVISFADAPLKALETLRARFGDEVACIVVELSQDRNVERSARKVAQIDGASTLSAGAKIVSLAKLLDNLHGLASGVPETWTTARVQDHFEWAFDVVSALTRDCPAAAASMHRELQGLLSSTVTLADDSKVPVVRAGYRAGEWRASRRER